MKTPTRLLVAEDHDLLREGLCSLLADHPGLEVVGKARDGREAVAAARTLSPDVILMDLSMPTMNGIEAVREIIKRTPHAKIIALTQHNTGIFIQEAFEAGVKGYVLKDCPEGELYTAIDTVMAGKTYLSPDISNLIVAGYVGGGKALKGGSPTESLSRREREILTMIAEGRRTNEIADRLFISVKTVQKHRSNLMRKLDLHNVAAVTAFAMKHGLMG
jgi:two-component system response regulator NreC